MNLIHKLNIVFLFLMVVFQLRAQTDFRPGYVITYKNDTIHGLIDYTQAVSNAGKCVFKGKSSSPVKEFMPADIKGYRFPNSKYFISRKLIINGEQKPVFLEFLVDGVANLYSFRDGNVTRFFVHREDMPMYELINSEYISSLKLAFGDCPRLFPSIENLDLDVLSLIEITRRYNRYVSSAKTIYYEKPPVIKVKAAPFVSANSSVLDFKNSTLYDAFDFKTSYYPSVGSQFTTSFPKWVKEIITIQGSGEISQSHYYGNTLHPLNANIFEEVNLNMVSFKGKAGFKFTYPKGKIRPALMVGGHMLHVLKKDGRRLEDNLDPSGIFISAKNENLIARNLYGYNIDFGINYYHTAKIVPFLMFGYASSHGENKGEETRLILSDGNKTLISELTTFNVNVGIYF